MQQHMIDPFNVNNKHWKYKILYYFLRKKQI